MIIWKTQFRPMSSFRIDNSLLPFWWNPGTDISNQENSAWFGTWEKWRVNVIDIEVVLDLDTSGSPDRLLLISFPVPILFDTVDILS